MSTVNEIVVPAREGRGVVVRVGQLLDIIALEGHQVGDLVAWRRDDPRRILVARAHGIVQCLHPLGRWIASSSPTTAIPSSPSCGTMLASTISSFRAATRNAISRDFGLQNHRSCLRNLEAGARPAGRNFRHPWRTSVECLHAQSRDARRQGSHRPRGASRRRNDHSARRDGSWHLLSACPQDLTPCNAFNPTPMKLVVREAD